MSGDGAKEGPDYFGFFKHELEDLFSGENDADVDFLPLLGFKSDLIKKELGEKDVNVTQGSCDGGEFGLKKSDILFRDGLGGELTDYRKEKLKGLLKESVSVLTQEVDQMVEVVFATCQLKHRLKSKATGSGSSSASGDGDNNQACPSKKLKSPMGYHMRETKFDSLTNILSKGESCAECKVTQTPQWRYTPGGSRICNACGLRLRKGNLQLSPERRDHTIAAFQGQADNKNKDVTEDLEFFLDNDRVQVEQTMKKYADEISSSLGHMEQQLEGFLDTVTSKCRNMTFFEKQRLCTMLKGLPPMNFDRAVGIIKRSGGLEQKDKDDILVDLEDMDDTVLWRLYYYAKTVENAQKLLA